MTPQPRRGWQFPIARFLLRLTRRFANNWLERHRHPVNFALHCIGIPLVLWSLWSAYEGHWQWGLVQFSVGYLLQFVGHFIEGNDVGELVPLKRLLGLPSVSVARR
jgi:hypothetical protein